jgi:hypothetical protein
MGSRGGFRGRHSVSTLDATLNERGKRPLGCALAIDWADNSQARMRSTWNIVVDDEAARVKSNRKLRLMLGAGTPLT